MHSFSVTAGSGLCFGPGAHQRSLTTTNNTRCPLRSASRLVDDPSLTDNGGHHCTGLLLLLRQPGQYVTGPFAVRSFAFNYSSLICSSQPRIDLNLSEPRPVSVGDCRQSCCYPRTDDLQFMTATRPTSRTPPPPNNRQIMNYVRMQSSQNGTAPGERPRGSYQYAQAEIIENKKKNWSKGEAIGGGVRYGGEHG